MSYLLSVLLTSFVVVVVAGELSLCPAVLESGLRHPTHLLALPGSADDFLISEQAGSLLQIKGGKRSLLLNLSSQILTSGQPFEQRGLLSFTLDSEELPRRLFVCYSGRPEKTSDDHTMVVSRYDVHSEQFLEVDVTSERRLLTIGQPSRSQNGGYIFFDRSDPSLLYVTVGSGGGPNQWDRFNLSSLLGKVLRLNVSDQDGPYTIPKGNPYSKSPDGALPEIYASGFWNPWRCTFDWARERLPLEASRVICGDVGAGEKNEDTLLLLEPGGVYNCHVDCGKRGTPVEPLYRHSHHKGQAIIGGPVYRGNDIQLLKGSYLFGDFVHGSLHTLVESSSGLWTKTDIALSKQRPLGEFFLLSINTDHKGEPLIMTATGLDSTVASGTLYRLLPICSSTSLLPGFWLLFLGLLIKTILG